MYHGKMEGPGGILNDRGFPDRKISQADRNIGIKPVSRGARNHAEIPGPDNVRSSIEQEVVFQAVVNQDVEEKRLIRTSVDRKYP